MAQSLFFDTGSITLAIQGDASRLLTFNPADFNLASKFFDLVQKAEEKSKEFSKKAKEADSTADITPKIKLIKEMDAFFREEIDGIFGEGAAKLIFHDMNVMSQGKNGDYLLSNFLMALYPYFEKSSKSKVERIVKDHKPKSRR